MTPQAVIKRFKLSGATINPDGSLDVNGDVDLSKQGYAKPRLPARFGVVTGNFYAPASVTSLEGSPTMVGGHYICSGALVTDLRGAPGHVDGNFVPAHLKYLTSLEGSPTYIGGDMHCNDCPRLTSAKGLPKHIGGRLQYGHTTGPGPGFEDSLAAERLLL